MAPRPSRGKPNTFSFFLVFIIMTLIIFNIHYLRKLHNETQVDAVTYLRSATSLNWFELIARELGQESINVALVNVAETTSIRTKGKVVKVDFRMVDKATMPWSDLFPEWIEETTRKCPELPMPVFEKYEELDVVVARAPSSDECGEFGVRDVSRLQVNLVVANLLVRSGRKQSPVFAVFIGGSCAPMREIFKCDDLVLHVADSWIYKPRLGRMKQLVHMPVGSCQLSPKLPAYHDEEEWMQSGFERRKKPREAYATILHSMEEYVCGAIALAQSIIQANTTRDLVLLADDHISPKSLAGLQSAGWIIKRFKRIRSPYTNNNKTYNIWNYSKLRLWQLQDYDKVIFIDSDFIVMRSLDEFFSYPEISAKGNSRHLFNSGLMVVEPSECMFRTLMEQRWEVRSYNGGDQGFLNEMYTWWHRLTNKTNHLTFFFKSPTGDIMDDMERRVPHGAYAVHYLGRKPWACFRDYDCNWDFPLLQDFASDAANKIWWDVYDKMPQNLRQYCSMSYNRRMYIEQQRRKARDANFSDGHWRIEIKDPRKHDYHPNKP